MQTLTAKPSNSLAIQHQKVLTAYFAKKEVECYLPTDETHAYTFKSNNPTATPESKKKIASLIYKNIKDNLASQQKETTVEEITNTLTKAAYAKGDSIDIPLVKPSVKFTKLKKVNWGDEVFLVIETENIPSDREVRMQLKQGGAEKVLTEVDEPIEVTQNDSCTTVIKACIGEYAQSTDIANPEDFENFAITTITLKTTDEATEKAYIEALEGCNDMTDTYLHIDAEPEGNNWFEVLYGEVMDNRHDFWYYGDGNWLVVEKVSCCEADLTKEQLKRIAIHASDANIEKYLEGFNDTFRKFEINTCLRKAHFLAQVIHETGSFKYNEEGNGKQSVIAHYNGWHGRGLIQLTGEDNYKKFGKAINEDVYSSASNRDKVKDSPYAAYSAGWYWKDDAKLNDEADANDFIHITRKVNGGFNGYDDRELYIKKAFKILVDNCSAIENSSTTYKFKDSESYNEKRASFAWGLWNDPDLNKIGKVKDKSKALEGYKRFIELTNSNFSATNWYKIKNIDAFSSIKYSINSKVYVKVRKAAELRIAALK